MSIKFSILLLNYNQAKFLPESLGSILNQTRRADEIIIADDSSTDESVEIIKSYQSKYSELQFTQNQRNMGMHDTVNRCAALATGDFLAILAADDLLLPSCLENHANLVQKHPHIGLSCSDLTIFEDRKPYCFEFYPYLPGSEALVLAPNAFIALLRKTRFWIASCGCFYNRRLFLEYGGYDPALKSLGDYHINYQIGFRHGIAYIPKPLASVRVVPNSYGNLVGKNFNQRYRVMEALMSKVSKAKDLAFRKAMKDSRILSYNGLFISLYLLVNPVHWKYLPGIIIKTWKSLLKKLVFKILKRKISPFSFPPARTFSSLSELEMFNREISTL